MSVNCVCNIFRYRWKSSNNSLKMHICQLNRQYVTKHFFVVVFFWGVGGGGCTVRNNDLNKLNKFWRIWDDHRINKSNDSSEGLLLIWHMHYQSIIVGRIKGRLFHDNLTIRGERLWYSHLFRFIQIRILTYKKEYLLLLSKPNY
jgi:hypothetical protein